MSLQHTKVETDTTRQVEHSPLPWKLHDDENANDFHFRIKSPWTETHKPGEAEGYGDYRGLTVCIVEHQGEGAPVVTKRQARANAAYIVKACNQFPELLKALKEVPAWFSEWNVEIGSAEQYLLDKINTVIQNAESNG